MLTTGHELSEALSVGVAVCVRLQSKRNNRSASQNMLQFLANRTRRSVVPESEGARMVISRGGLHFREPLSS